MKRATLFVLSLLLGACNISSPATPTSPAPTPVTQAPPTSSSTPAEPQPSYKVAAFYYPWYGSPQFDGKWIHWGQNGHTPPQDIGSDYFPVLGPYSSNDPAVVDQHMRWLRQAGVGVIIVSWWGQGSQDERPVPLILQTAARYGIKVTFHIEPYHGRTADGLVSDIQYLYQHYGNSPAFFYSSATSPYSTKAEPKGMFFVWCIKYAADCGNGPKVQASYWQSAVDAIHALPQGGLIIANNTDGAWVSGGHFDGLYNYTSLHADKKDPFAWARTLPAGSLYIPSVIPGFSAQRVGYPSDTTVPRSDGQTYSDEWTAALSTGVAPAMLTITSFNEWHEGSMIEPAAQGANDGLGHNYADYGSLPPDGYLTLTRQWVDKFKASAQAPAYAARIQIRTTSDWTTVSLVKGGRWLQPALVSSSPTATNAGFESGDSFLLTQSLDDANAATQVEMTWDVQLSGLKPGGELSFAIERGNIGTTQLTVYSYASGEPIPVGVFHWGGLTTGRNTNIVTLGADRLLK